jgi:hypothetical protein
LYQFFYLFGMWSVFDAYEYLNNDWENAAVNIYIALNN